MQKNTSYQRFSAWALALVFTLTYALKTVHVLLNDHHSDHPVCTDTSEGKGPHIHGEEYTPDSCSLCAFVVSTPEMPALAPLSLSLTKLPDSQAGKFYYTLVLAKTGDKSTFRRGPPSA